MQAAGELFGSWHGDEVIADKLTGRFLRPDVAAAVAVVQSCSLVVVASPTYKAAYTGLLKLFLDRIGTGELAGVTAVPLMLGGDMRHSLAPEVFLKPVLVELVASCPTAGLFLPESEYAGSKALDAWLDRTRPLVEPSIENQEGLNLRFVGTLRRVAD